MSEVLDGFPPGWVEKYKQRIEIDKLLGKQAVNTESEGEHDG